MLAWGEFSVVFAAALVAEGTALCSPALVTLAAGDAKDSLWSLDLCRCESILLKSY